MASSGSSPSSAAGICRRNATVCVTGAGGFIGSWMVKLLLDRGYTVRGTARNPDDLKNNHLWSLAGARERLTLFKTDLLDYAGLRRAFENCHGVFHTASPMTNAPAQVVTAVDGTKNVMNAAAEAGVRRVVFTSSIGAVNSSEPGHGCGRELLERSRLLQEDWSLSLSIARSLARTHCALCSRVSWLCRQNWYCYGKMLAERIAQEMAREKKIELVAVVPSATLGPMLQSAATLSITLLLTYLCGTRKAYPNAVQGFVDVRDVARAHVLAYEKPSARGRYLCIACVLHRKDVLDLLAEMFPEYPITSRCEEEGSALKHPFKFSSQRLKDLGLRFLPFRETLYEMVISAKEKGHLLHPSSYYRSSM